LKGCTTNFANVRAEFIIDAYHQLWRIEKGFRMSKQDLQARPVYHHKRESIEAHLTIVFAALAVSHWIERRTGWTIKKFVRTTRRYRTLHIRAGRQALTAADPLPDDLRQALAKINADNARLKSPKSGRPGGSGCGRWRARSIQLLAPIRPRTANSGPLPPTASRAKRRTSPQCDTRRSTGPNQQVDRH
jgi:hypothetical protein